MKKWMAIPALAGAVVLGGVAMVANADKGETAKEGSLTVEEVETKAVEAVGGNVTEIEYEKSENKYEVEVNNEGTEYDLDVDATSGNVLSKDVEDDRDAKVKKDSENALTVVKSDKEQNTKSKATKVKYITTDEAIAIALKSAQGKVTKAELDDDDDRVHYEIEIEDGTYEYEFEIDAITGNVLSKEVEKESSATVKKESKNTDSKNTQTVAKSDKEQKKAKSNATEVKYITADEAIAIAMKKAQGKVTDIELDKDDGRAYYEIEIEDGTYEYEFEIDAITGNILNFEKDRDDD